MNFYARRYEIDNRNVPADAAKNDFESVVSTLRINLSNLEGGHVEPKRDDAIYTCESSGNSFGPGVRNNIDFQVHCEYARRIYFLFRNRMGFATVKMSFSRIKTTLKIKV